MNNSEIIQHAWDGQAPDWIVALAYAADKGMSRRKLADVIGYSPAAISQVLSGKYKGSFEKLAASVRRALMHDAVQCPVLGEITGERCLAEQRKPLAATSGMRVRLWRACRNCKYNIGREE